MFLQTALQAIHTGIHLNLGDEFTSLCMSQLIKLYINTYNFFYVSYISIKQGDNNLVKNKFFNRIFT